MHDGTDRRSGGRETSDTFPPRFAAWRGVIEDYVAGRLKIGRTRCLLPRLGGDISFTLAASSLEQCHREPGSDLSSSPSAGNERAALVSALEPRRLRVLYRNRSSGGVSAAMDRSVHTVTAVLGLLDMRGSSWQGAKYANTAKPKLGRSGAPGSCSLIDSRLSVAIGSGSR
jgi:hypothetical protein